MFEHYHRLLHCHHPFYEAIIHSWSHQYTRHASYFSLYSSLQHRFHHICHVHDLHGYFLIPQLSFNGNELKSNYCTIISGTYHVCSLLHTSKIIKPLITLPSAPFFSRLILFGYVK
ncbi:hypothetical protein BDA99DRAFT_526575 [Phascolomyces articulosus]|uniref:Uncharacterized protein n=1 Tax=Phascolomyces articulosus TaxID=60185 RepID=A0AAD5JP80_9FUNG|nr:hypothetical protein BDA99DRAFT_526575 [Phascolomyces articulosus]